MPPTPSDPPAPGAATTAQAAPPAPHAELWAARFALATERQHATRARQHSLLLRDRAAQAARAATASCEFAERYRALWQDWHLLWAGIAGPGGPRFVRVCAYCGAAALPGADPFAPEAWRPVPPWVRERIGAGALGVPASHGACPACARARLGGEDR